MKQTIPIYLHVHKMILFLSKNAPINEGKSIHQIPISTPNRIRVIEDNTIYVKSI